MKKTLNPVFLIKYTLLVVVIFIPIFIGLHIYPLKCQEVKKYGRVGDVDMDGVTHAYCYTVFDKKYWSIPKWSSVRERE